ATAARAAAARSASRCPPTSRSALSEPIRRLAPPVSSSPAHAPMPRWSTPRPDGPRRGPGAEGAAKPFSGARCGSIRRPEGPPRSARPKAGTALLGTERTGAEGAAEPFGGVSGGGAPRVLPVRRPVEAVGDRGGDGPDAGRLAGG